VDGNQLWSERIRGCRIASAEAPWDPGEEKGVLLWTLIIIGLLIIVARATFGHRVALLLVAVWIAVAIAGWATGIGVRK
jgi:hypothetical protein